MGQSTEAFFDYNRVDEAKIRKLLHSFDIESLSDFHSIETRCYQSTDSSSYKVHRSRYTFKAPIEQVWDNYLSAPPHVAWQCLLVDYVFSFTGKAEEISHQGEEFSGLQEGQLHFLNLNFMGLFKLAVGHKVTQINAEEKSIQFCYLENGASQGSQWIRLKALADSTTEVTHYTRYKSSSKFRDKNLYPTLHSMIINAFHHNIKRNLRRKMRNTEKPNKKF